MNTLAKSQQELAGLLLTTNTHAKVRRRKQNKDGTYEFYHVMRDTHPIDFRITEEEFAFVHHTKTPEAPLSPIIVNLRNLPKELHRKIAETLAEIPFDATADFCTGIPNAAIPFATEFSKVSGVPYVTLFEKDDTPGKPHILPAKKAPKGKGNTLFIIDDLVTKAGSKLDAAKVAEQLGYNVIGIVVLIDREQGGVEIIKKAGYTLYYALKLTDILKHYLKKKMITKQQFDESTTYLENSRQI